MSNGKVDTTRTDQAYWDAQLESRDLGMNRGTTFPAEELLLNEADRKARSKKLKKRGPHFKRGPKGPKAQLNKNEVANAARITVTPHAPGGMFQFGGFRHVGFSKQIGAGKGQKGGKKGEEKRDFIQYVGNAYDLARLEESINREESGRVRPSGHGPDR